MMLTHAPRRYQTRGAHLALWLFAAVFCWASNVHGAQAQRSLRFDGFDDFAREAVPTESPSGFDLATFTVEGWILPLRSARMHVFSDSAYNLQLDVGSQGSLGVRFTLYSPGPGGASAFFRGAPGFSPVLKQWNHVAAGYDAATNRCFMAVNGRVDLRSDCITGALDRSFDQIFGIGTSSAGGRASQPTTSDLFDGFVYGVRISRTLRYPADFTPTCPQVDDLTVALWQFREAPSATSFADRSAHGKTLSGVNGAVTSSTGVPACAVSVRKDFDNDGRSDIGVYRDGLWSVLKSSVNFDPAAPDVIEGIGGAEWTPIYGDYDGDGQTDAAAYLNGIWRIRRSSDGAVDVIQAGGPSFVPVPGDYDGDGKTDVAVYSNGVWSIFRSSDGVNDVVAFGGVDWLPVPADYDGDGKTDVAVHSGGAWSIRRSTDSAIVVTAHGGADWLPVPGDYDGDGKADVAVYHSTNGFWSVRYSAATGSSVAGGHGGAGWLPMLGDYDGDGKNDFAVYHTSGVWSVKRSSDQRVAVTIHGGGPADVPLK